MSVVPISLADLIQLSRYAQNAGTETQYIALSLEWAAHAQLEIDRLTTELKQVKATWIEPKAVIPHRPCTPSPDHPSEYVTGLNIPETPA